MTKLVIVESQPKVRPVTTFLGSGWRVEATLGHIRDLPERALGVDIEAGFAPQYTILPGKANLVRRLFKAMSDAEAIYLATDPDREGEAMAWHLLALANLPQEKPVYRVRFSAITKAAVQAAIADPRPLNLNLVEAQQTRRIVDRLVGYLVSPLAGKLLHQNVSAGRVQSVCLRLVVERERELTAFTPAQYWTLTARFKTADGEFTAPLHAVKGVKAALKQRELLDRLVHGLLGAAFWVDKVAQGEKNRHPLPPFTTSTLQQAASKALGFSPDKTMKIAQMLYEAGQITYHRTDSVVVVPEAIEAAQGHIRQTYGEGYLPDQPQAHITATQHAQEAHEAIRPADVMHLPGSPEETEEGAGLYALIWRRFVASQMADARYVYHAAQILAGKAQGQPYPLDFRAGSRTLVFDGFLKVYEEAPDDGEQPVMAGSLPPLVEGQTLTLAALQPEAHTTQAPSRYTEAALVKALEERGIGRPSTYAGMVKTLKAKGYARLEHKRLVPTEMGLKLCDLLMAKFGGQFDYGYTAQLEAELDHIARGETTRLATLQAFWAAFQPLLGAAGAEAAIQPAPQVPAGTCPQCGSPLVERRGALGPFIGCVNFPKCRYTAGGPARPVKFSKKREGVKV